MPISKYSVGFQGELGAFSHAAALKMLGPRARLTPYRTFKDVFEALDSDAVSSIVIPIENTLHGSIHENYDYLLDYGFNISGETSIRISHQLIAMPGVKFSSLRQVISHPVALNQCKRFLDRHTSLTPVAYYDTAGSVKALRDGEWAGTAAIASEMAAHTYGGSILKRNIEDLRQNFTRFFLLAKQPVFPRSATAAQKTSLVFSTVNQPGALFRAMACFALRDLDLTKIESRPIRGKPWEYLFYVDLLGSLNEKATENAIDNLRECSQMVKILGSYRPTP